MGNSNKNVLADYGCPECGSEGPFRVTMRMLITAMVGDDGYALDDAYVCDDSLYDSDSRWECNECGKFGLPAEFDLTGKD